MSADKLLDSLISCNENEEPSTKKEDTDSFKLYGCDIIMLSIIFNERRNNTLLPQSLTDPTSNV